MQPNAATKLNSGNTYKSNQLTNSKKKFTKCILENIHLKNKNYNLFGTIWLGEGPII